MTERFDPRPGLAEAFDWRAVRTWAVFLGFAVAYGAGIGAANFAATLLTASSASEQPWITGSRPVTTTEVLD